MIIAKVNPVGIDAEVAKIQTAIHKAFDVKWSVGQDTIDGVICYPRCYVNFKRRNKDIIYGQKIIEHFDASTLSDSDTYKDINTEYKDILDGEENKMIVVSSYDIFPVNETHTFESTMIECIFIVNLDYTHPNIKHRADEEVRIEVKKVLEKLPDIKIHKTVRTLSKIYGDVRYPTAIDIHPLHCFKVILSLERFKGENRVCK